jgi:hypothetical protein
MTQPAEGPGAPLEPPGNPRPRWMVTPDRIRLTGLLKKTPAAAGVFYWTLTGDCREETPAAAHAIIFAA